MGRPLLRSIGGLAATVNALRPTQAQQLSVLTFTSGWHVSELPLLALGTQVVTTAASMRKGGWKTPAGKLSIAATVASTAGLVTLHRASMRAEAVLEDALIDGLGAEYRDVAIKAGVAPAIGPAIRPVTITPTLILRRTLCTDSNISYGPAGRRNLLDVWRRADIKPGAKAPVLIQVHGGGWAIGSKQGQGYPLMARLAEAGWVCVPINYRLSPRATFPDHIVDVKRAIAWVKEHIEDYGGDPNFVVITGGSAGGHLSALATVTPNFAEFQPGFEDADTSLAAGVPFYGVYDMRDWNGRGGPPGTMRFLERTVMKTSRETDPHLWDVASPIHHVNADTPPMMILHGTNDTLVPVDGARRMTQAIRTYSKNPVVYAELPMTQHAFDSYNSLRTRYAVRAVEQFLAYVWATQAHANAPQSVAAFNSSNDTASASA